MRFPQAFDAHQPQHASALIGQLRQCTTHDRELLAHQQMHFWTSIIRHHRIDRGIGIINDRTAHMTSPQGVAGKVVADLEQKRLGVADAGEIGVKQTHHRVLDTILGQADVAEHACQHRA